MTVEVRPLGVRCNLQCLYCYQNPQRDARNIARNYDIEKIKQAIEREGGPFTLFGGEALVIPEPDLEELWSWGFVRWGKNSIQTNGVLINDNHIRMFKKYSVHVGISIDGPDELNALRSAGSPTKTLESSRTTQRNIERLCMEGLSPSLIITLHRLNATGHGLDALCNWLRKMESIGVKSARLHILEVDDESVRRLYALSIEENIVAFKTFADVEKSMKTLQLDVFVDIRNQLLGRDQNTTCVWNACDPFTTRAVRGIEGRGQRSNCGRTNKDGIDFVKANSESYERYVGLYYTSQEFGGCGGCRFFLMCKGQCPGTALDGDWRNRSEHCAVWKTLFTEFEHDLIASGHTPISDNSELRARIEEQMIRAWRNGSNPPISTLLSQPTSASRCCSHGDAPHGDAWFGTPQRRDKE